MIRQWIPHQYRVQFGNFLSRAHCSQTANRNMKNAPNNHQLMNVSSVKTLHAHIHNMKQFKNRNGQESLYNVMKAYSVYDREVGT